MINAPNINEIVRSAFRARFSDLDFLRASRVLGSFNFESLDRENRDPLDFDPFAAPDSGSLPFRRFSEPGGKASPGVRE